MIESATHLAWSHVTWSYTSTWSEAVALWYSLAWFDRYLYDDLARTDGLPVKPKAGGLTANYVAVDDHGVSKKYRSAYSVGGYTCDDMVARTDCTQPATKKSRRSARKAAAKRRSHRASRRASRR